MPPRRSHEPLPPKADEIWRTAKRLINVHGDHGGNYRNGRLSVSYTEARGTQVLLHDTAKTWEGQIVFKYERDHEAERTSVSREFMSLGIPMKGGAKYWSLTEFKPDLADEVLSIMHQALVLDDLARVLGEVDDAETP